MGVEHKLRDERPITTEKTDESAWGVHHQAANKRKMAAKVWRDEKQVIGVPSTESKYPQPLLSRSRPQARTAGASLHRTTAAPSDNMHADAASLFLAPRDGGAATWEK